ncbi:MAG: hypothetical protein J6R59_01625 [Paludibacteraceae bacterium]|nr:hypothetical protein [Paludibacteraceae bacterium]
MDKAELERTKVELERKLLIDTKNLIIQSREALEEFEKMKKSSDLIGWIGLTFMITFSLLIGIGFLTLMFFL